MRRLVAPLCFLMASCTSSSAPYEMPTRAYTPTSLQQQPITDPVRTGPFQVMRSNSSIARDILQLTFFLENGNQLNTLTRFEGPISVSIEGRALASLQSELTALLQQIRNEAGINIHQTSSQDANITLQLIPRAQIKKLVPNAACFVAPNVSGLSDYLANRTVTNNAWSRLTRRTKMTIFLPSDGSQQEIRDCLHEEMTQALGPVNDLYYLSDSVFNDDNVQAKLTEFDMLVLRTIYDPSLSNGMSRAEVTARLSTILTRLNPVGDSLPGIQRSAVSREWNTSITQALGSDTPPSARIRAAERAVLVAKKQGFQDVRLGFSYVVLGRVTMAVDASQSKKAFEQADAAYAQVSGTQIHRAFVASQLAAFSLSAGDASGTLDLVRPHQSIARAHENFALLSTLQLLEAEALDLIGRTQDARAVRLDSLASARYGFGSEMAVEARLREIASLSPR